jgi:N-acetylglucosamine-6-phosphate deacetylase
MDAAVRNFLRFTRCEIAEALAAATLAPARAIGEERRGRIAPGCAADLVLLDRDLRVTGTVIAGAFTAVSVAP